MLRSFYDRINQKVLASANAVQATAKAHPFASGALAALVLVVNFAAGKALDLVYATMSPQAGSEQIIAQQQEHFSQLNDAIKSLSGRVDASNVSRFSDLKLALDNAMKTGNLMSAKLEQLTEDNERIRSTLRRDKGLDGGVDFLLGEGQAFKIDENSTIGFSRVALFGGVSRANFSLTSLNNKERNIDKQLTAGQGLNLINSSGQDCQITYLGVTNPNARGNYVGKFAYQCKTTADVPRQT